MNKQLIAIIIFVLFTHQSAMGQRRGRAAARETIRANTIEVVQSYRPEIQQSQKPLLAPELPPTDTVLGNTNYEVPVQTLNFTYRSQPLKPLALLGKDTGILPFANYVKLGGGNLSTLYLDAGIGSLKGSNYETAIHLHHLSQKGAIKFQESMLSGVEATGALYTDKHVWKAAVNGMRNSHYQYGYDHAAFPNFVPNQQVLNGARIQVGLNNSTANRWDINYAPQLTMSLFGGSRIDGEQQISVNAPFTKNIDTSLRIHIGISASYTALQISGRSTNSGIFGVSPGISFQKDNLQAHAFLSPTIGNGGTGYLLPDLQAGIQLKPFAIKVGWKANLIQNSYERFFVRNPFLNESNIGVLVSQYRTDELFADVQTNIGNYIYLSGRASWWQFRNMPLFINDRNNRHQFDIITDPLINAVSLQANVRYQVARTFSLGVSGIWFNYYNSTVTHIWHEPGIQLKADFHYHPIQDLTVTAYMMAMDQIYGIDINGRAVKLNTIMDIGFGAEYTIIPRLSVFLDINNLLNNKYHRWHYYPSYGFNIYGGLRFKF